MIPMLETPGSEALRVELAAFTGPLDLLYHRLPIERKAEA